MAHYTSDAVCAEQFMDGQKHDDAKGQGMSAPAVRAAVPKPPEKLANQGHDAPEFGKNAIPVSLDGFLTFNSREGACCADLP